MQKRTKLLILGVALLVLVGGLTLRNAVRDDDYELQVLVPTAQGLAEGTPVHIAGHPAGKVTAIEVDGKNARLTLTLDPDRGPLHAGSTVHSRWVSVVGHRTVDLKPGDESNEELPSGSVIVSQVEAVELDDILATLDKPTRKKMRGLVADLESVITDNEDDLRRTLMSAGPFVEALGEVLRAVGEDGPAIANLVNRLHGITNALAKRDGELSATVSNLTTLLTSASAKQKRLRAALDEVNTVVDAGNQLFGDLPDAVDATVPLLQDLQPAVDRLPAVARQLNPVLTDLRPVVYELRPTLAAARNLLGTTPALLRNGNQVIPALDSAITDLQPAVEFLRPYTPEVIGFLSNWTGVFSGKNQAGHFGRAMIPASATSFNSNPGVLPPGMTQWEEPLPGQLIGDPWTDANGDGVR